MGLDVLFWIVLLTWMAKRSTEDVLHAVKGTPNPRHQARVERIKRGDSPNRYGVRGWLDDATEDYLRANTQWRRSRAARKAAARLDVPLDDLAEAVREPKAQPRPERVYDPNNSRTCPACKDEVTLDGRPCPRCLAEQQRRNAEWEAQGGLDQVFGPPSNNRPAQKQPVPQGGTPKSLADGWTGMRTNQGEPMCQRCQKAYRQLNPPAGCGCPAASEHTAQIIQFPNPKNIEREIIMANSEAAGLSTAIAFAEAAASAHQSFATAGAEGYVGALQRGDMDGEPVDTAREAMEASGIAADKWNAHKATLEAQLNLKEAYQAQPGAANKEYLLNG